MQQQFDVKNWRWCSRHFQFYIPRILKICKEAMGRMNFLSKPDPAHRLAEPCSILNVNPNPNSKSNLNPNVHLKIKK